MTPPNDSQVANDNANPNDSSHTQYELLGHFEPKDAERILERLEEQHLSFKVQEYTELRYSGSRPLMGIYVRPEDKKEAEAINDRTAARSRAAAGIGYVTIGGVICTATLLEMRSGVRTMPYVERFGHHIELPLEMVAGIAGIVVFMGFVQLVIAVILGLQQRRRSQFVQSNHLTNR